MDEVPARADDKPLLETLAGRTSERLPIWLMRQAGRYLPEYREVRAKAKNFIDFCFRPDLAAEATLQPLRRFDLDAAIVFSDILVVPLALGQKVWFEEGKGPRLEAIREPVDLSVLSADDLEARLAAVYETLEVVAAELPAGRALIGFAGAPWTLASYMIEGQTSRDFAQLKRFAYGRPEAFGHLLDLLVEAVARHLVAQVRAGAEVVQIFDSWAGVLPEPELKAWSLAPMAEIARRFRADCPDVPVIAFPRGAGLSYAAFAESGGFDALGLDTTVPLGWAAERLQPKAVVQGNLDPVKLLVGGGALARGVDSVLETLGPQRLVFNLGHGVLPETPPEHVAELVARVRGGPA
ncbi:MAG: uroporphyrinogen decarboxylase [Kiloniellales bacterium]|nr:uroporphyrinogen decarboxylase [Kiloniellales bacterium]